jgi:hypothetical protein
MIKISLTPGKVCSPEADLPNEALSAETPLLGEFQTCFASCLTT